MKLTIVLFGDLNKGERGTSVTVEGVTDFKTIEGGQILVNCGSDMRGYSFDLIRVQREVIK